MARRHRRLPATRFGTLTTELTCCPVCAQPLWVAYTTQRTLALLTGVWRFTVQVRQCVNRACPRYHVRYHPEEEGALALPKGEFGLDVVAHIGALRYGEHRSVPEIHRDLGARGVPIAERTVTYLLERYEELVALRLADHTRLRAELSRHGRVVLALDGLQPDVGHEVLWVLRDCLSGEVLLARSLLGATTAELVALLREVQQALPVPIEGVISDGQQTIRAAVAQAVPGARHQLCHFHYLREAATPIYEADRHAKKELKKQVRGVRPFERALEQRTDPQAAVVRDYCLAVRSALTDDGEPPLCASGLQLHDRLEQIATSLSRVEEKGGAPENSGACAR
jgi:Transposase, Mutator family